MDWTEAIENQIDHLKPVTINDGLKEKVVGLIDFTNLNENETEQNLSSWCQKAQNTYGQVAAICTYPQFVRLMVANFAGTSIKIDTVANFPSGDERLQDVLIEINRALTDGATEIDVVFPYHRYLAGERQYATSFVETCKAACGEQALLKVILETGALGDSAIIADATYDAILGGADFIKTSTGKVSDGASLEAAAVILLVIKHAQSKVHRRLGIKISGGVKDLQQALLYLELAENIMGRDWPSKETFRIGSSKLLDEILR